jgi:hypothetical protein
MNSSSTGAFFRLIATEVKLAALLLIDFSGLAALGRRAVAQCDISQRVGRR